MSDHPWVLFVLFPIVAYVIGATPFAVLIARANGKELRKSGSGNVGATNVGRVVGRGWGYLCFFLDAGKGLAAVVLAGALAGGGPASQQGGDGSLMVQGAQVVAGCAAVAGHVLSFWLGFRGGKGVATSLGVVVGIWPYFTYAGLLALAIWIIVTLTTRYVSLGSVVAAVAFLPLYAAFNWGHLMDRWPTGILAIVIIALILVRHGGNIRRLMKGTEKKIR